MVFGAHLTLRKEEVMSKMVEALDWVCWIIWIKGSVTLGSVLQTQLRMGMRPHYAAFALLAHTLVFIPIISIGIKETKRVMRARKEAKK